MSGAQILHVTTNTFLRTIVAIYRQNAFPEDKPDEGLSMGPNILGDDGLKQFSDDTKWML